MAASAAIIGARTLAVGQVLEVVAGAGDGSGQRRGDSRAGAADSIRGSLHGDEPQFGDTGSGGERAAGARHDRVAAGERADVVPFADDSFDVVCCQFRVMFFTDQVAGYAEARRVLKPGGRFVFNI